jgi:hypothetical protein
MGDVQHSLQKKTTGCEKVITNTAMLPDVNGHGLFLARFANTDVPVVNQARAITLGINLISNTIGTVRSISRHTRTHHQEPRLNPDRGIQ